MYIVPLIMYAYRYVNTPNNQFSVSMTLIDVEEPKDTISTDGSNWMPIFDMALLKQVNVTQ